MGVINITPDSFSDGGQFLDSNEAVNHALELVREGANIIDLGGESTRPGALRVKIDEEQARVLPVIEALMQNAEFKSSGAIISIDTMNAQTAALAVAAGANKGEKGETGKDCGGIRIDIDSDKLALGEREGDRGAEIKIGEVGGAKVGILRHHRI